MDKLLIMLGEALLEYGAFGMLTGVGWALVGWFLYRDFKKKNEVSAEVQARDTAILAKDKVIATKDEELKAINAKLATVTKDLSDERIKDLKETTDEYNEVVTSVNHTLDKLTVALHVKSSVND